MIAINKKEEYSANNEKRNSVNNKENRLNWKDVVQGTTPIMLFVLSILSGVILKQIDGIDDKLFRHLTNDDLHLPKSVAVTRVEFQLYQDFRNKELDSIRMQVSDLKSEQVRHIALTNENNNKLEKILEKIMK